MDLRTLMTADGMLVLEAIKRGLQRLREQFLVCEPLPRAQPQLSKGRRGLPWSPLSAQKSSPMLRSPGSLLPGPWPLAETQPAGSCPKAQGGPSQSRVGLERELLHEGGHHLSATETLEGAETRPRPRGLVAGWCLSREGAGAGPVHAGCVGQPVHAGSGSCVPWC